MVTEKSQSDARLANAQAEEAAAREERDVACAAADAAEALLHSQQTKTKQGSLTRERGVLDMVKRLEQEMARAINATDQS